MKGFPVGRKGSKKYTGLGGRSNGMFKASSFPSLAHLPREIKASLVNNANNAVTHDTWRNYNSLENHLVRCQDKYKMRFSFPMKEKHILTLVAFLREERGLKSSSIENCLCALRYIHLSKGVFLPCLRPEILKVILQGMSHEDFRKKRTSPDRLPVTLEVMLLLEMELEDAVNWSKEYKLLVWAVATLAFFGSFRIGELLSKRAKSIDPEVDLLLKDVKLIKRTVNKKKVELLEINLKSPKEATKNIKSIRVEVFSNGTPLCPIKAYKNYMAGVGVKRGNSAAFRLPVVGLAYRHQRFNLDLKRLLAKHVHYGSFTGHSFRSGLSSLLGKAGFSDAEVMAMGRWSGESFLHYVKSGRLARSRNSEWVGNFVKSSIKDLN